MGLDKLGILFIIIILPIALILNTYVNTQVDTLNMQLSYDTKLNNATYDAVKTFKINSLNEDASNLGDVRIGNINAAINVFFTSLSSNLNISGYSKQFLQEYVPALVFTMYDGYYVFSKYNNTLGADDYTADVTYNTDGTVQKYASTYQNSQQLYGLKPFVHYSCRYYDRRHMNDVVISYTLDNYITVQGKLDGEYVDKSGYLIDVSESSGTRIDGDDVYYRGIKITKEDILKDNLVIDDNTYETKEYKYHKVNGVKYYYDEDNHVWFSMLNGERENTNYEFDDEEVTKDDSAYNYYKDAIEFSKWVAGSKLKNITSNNADVSYEVYDENNTGKTKTGLIQNSDTIFNMKGIEEPESNFNVHRRDVIKYTIEKNLSIAIANYNTYNTTTGFDFRMPELNAEEWDRIQSNMTVISFLQGLPIGTKIYNGVSVVANNVNEEVVAEDSIYIGDANNNNYYPVTYKDYSSIVNPVGIYNVDLQRRQVEYNKQTYYYYPKLYYNVYSQDRSTVELYATETDSGKFKGNLYRYLDSIKGTNEGKKIAKAFYTALGRERKSRYNQRNNYKDLLTEKTE